MAKVFLNFGAGSLLGDLPHPVSGSFLFCVVLDHSGHLECDGEQGQGWQKQFSAKNDSALQASCHPEEAAESGQGLQVAVDLAKKVEPVATAAS